MKELSDKVSGSILTGLGFSELAKEVENVITNLGQSLTSIDKNQLGKGIAGYIANGTFYIDSGTLNAYKLSSVGSKQIAPAFTDGFKVEFNALIPNTGPANVNVLGLGVKNIKTQTGGDPVANNIAGFTTLIFNFSADEFRLVNPNVTGTAIDFETVQQMKNSTTLVVGDFVRTVGYTTKDDGGANSYSIVPDATDTDDGGTFINLPGTTLQAQGLFEDGIVRPQQYGAIFDNSTDDFTALRNANLNPVSRNVEYPGKVALVSQTLPFASQYYYHGVFGKTRIRSVTDGMPVVASQSWLTSETAAAAAGPLGRMHIEDFEFEGVVDNTDQICAIFHDFRSVFIRLRALLGGNGGIVFDNRNEAGVLILGTLIENRIYDPIISSCGGIGLDLGPVGGAKLTDGFCSNATVDMSNLGSPPLAAIRCGAGSGWFIEGPHTFGAIPIVGIQIDGAQKTRLTDFKVSSFSQRGVLLPNAQGDLILSGHINANSVTSVKRAVDISLSAAVVNTSAEIDIEVKLDTAITGIVCLNNQAPSIDLQASIRTTGLNKDLLTLIGGDTVAKQELVQIMQNASVAGVFTDKLNLSDQVGLRHAGKRLAYSFYSTVFFNPGPHTVTVPIRLTNFQKLIGTVNIEANDNHDAAVRVIYQARFYVSAKDNNDDTWFTGALIETTTQLGFQSPSGAPTISATHILTEDDGTIDIVFQFDGVTAVNAKGICSVTF